MRQWYLILLIIIPGYWILGQGFLYPDLGTDKYISDTLALIPEGEYNTVDVSLNGSQWNRYPFISDNGLKYINLPAAEGVVDIRMLNITDSLLIKNVKRFRPQNIGFKMLATHAESDLIAYARTDDRFSIADISDIDNINGTVTLNTNVLAWTSDTILCFTAKNDFSIYAFDSPIRNPKNLPSYSKIGETDDLIIDMSVDSSGDTLAILKEDGIELWKIEPGVFLPDPIASTSLDDPFSSIEFITLGFTKVVVVGGNDKKLRVWNPATGEQYDLNNIAAPNTGLRDLTYYEPTRELLLNYEDNLTADIRILKLELSQNTLTVKGGNNYSIPDQEILDALLYNGLLIYNSRKGNRSKIELINLDNQETYQFPSDSLTLIQVAGLSDGKIVFGNSKGEMITFQPLDLPYEPYIADTTDIIQLELLKPVFEYPSNIDMGQVCVNSIKDTILKDGFKLFSELPFRIDSIISKSGDNQFLSNMTFPIFVEGSNSQNIELTFIPKSPSGSKNDEINIYHQFGLSTFNINGWANDPTVELLVDTIDLGRAVVASVNQKNVEVLTNIDGQNLVIDNIFYDGKVLSINDDYPKSIPSGQSLNLDFSITSQTDTVINTFIDIYTENNCSPIHIPITAIFYAYNFTISPSSFDLGVIDCSTEKQFTVFIENNTDAELPLIIDPDEGVSFDGVEDIIIPEFQSSTLKFLITEAEEGAYEQKVQITHPQSQSGDLATTIKVDFVFDSIIASVAPKQIVFKPESIASRDSTTFWLFNDNLKEVKYLLTLEGNNKFSFPAEVVIGENDSVEVKLYYSGGTPDNSDYGVLSIVPVDCGDTLKLPVTVEFGDSDALLTFNTLAVDLGECIAVEVISTFYLYNEGSTYLSISDISPNETLKPHVNDIIFDNVEAARIEPGDSIQVTVKVRSDIPLGIVYSLIIVSNSKDNPSKIMPLSLDSDRLINYEIDNGVLNDVNPNSRMDLNLSLISNNINGFDDIYLLKSSERLAARVIEVTDSYISVDLLTPSINSMINDTLIFSHKSCSYLDTVIITGSTNSNFYLTSKLSLQDSRQAILLSQGGELELSLANPFDIDLEQLKSIDFYFNYDASIIGLRNQELLARKLSIGSGDIKEFVDDLSIMIDILPGYTSNNAANISIDSIVTSGIEQLTVNPTSLQLPFIDKDEIDSIRVFMISNGIEVNIKNLPVISEYLEMEVTLPESAAYSLSLIDLYGKTKYQSNIEGPVLTKEIAIPTHQFASGVYFLTFTSGTQSHSVKFTVYR